MPLSPFVRFQNGRQARLTPRSVDYLVGDGGKPAELLRSPEPEIQAMPLRIGALPDQRVPVDVIAELDGRRTECDRA